MYHYFDVRTLTVLSFTVTVNRLDFDENFTASLSQLTRVPSHTGTI